MVALTNSLKDAADRKLSIEMESSDLETKIAGDRKTNNQNQGFLKKVNPLQKKNCKKKG